ncbi:MAG: hypothetical protein HAW67_06835 [Endozoicomonadaceae bacterium]|nr:hypothetical protein [Endozoicomonadaceae bacterium]
MKKIVISILFLITCVTAPFTYAQNGELSESGYGIRLNDALPKIIPNNWTIKFADNTLRGYRIQWSKGQRWSETLQMIGENYNVSFLSDSENKIIYCTKSYELLQRGFTLVANEYEADKYNLARIKEKAEIQHIQYQALMDEMQSNDEKLNNLERQINSQLYSYHEAKNQLLANHGSANALGVPIGTHYVTMENEDNLITPIQLIAFNPKDSIKVVEPGDMKVRLNEYYKKRWNYEVILAADSEPLKVSIPYALTMPSQSLKGDTLTLSKSINHSDNDIAVFIKVLKTTVKSSKDTPDGYIELKYVTKHGE